MPKSSKTYPKIYPKSQPKKTKLKIQPKPVSITSRRSYWIFLTVAMVIFGLIYGYLLGIAVAAIGILLVSVLSVIGFAFYLRFKPSTLTAGRRATFIFGGASIIGFSIWAMMVLSLNAVGFNSQIDASMGYLFFAITSQVIFLIIGAFIGDLIGNNTNRLELFFKKITGK
jgi:hypothetical protein